MYIDNDREEDKIESQTKMITSLATLFPGCFGDSNPPREFEDEIYSEICSNNHSVRQVIGDAPYAGTNTSTMMALGSLNNPTPNMLAMGSNTLMPYHKRAASNYPSQSATLLRSSNHSYNGAFQV